MERGGRGGAPDPDSTSDLLEQRSRQRLAVADLGRAALTGASTEELARAAARIPRETMGAEHVLVLGLDDVDGIVSSSAGFDADTLTALRIPPDPVTFARAALDAAEPLLVIDWSADDRYVADEILRDLDIRSACSAVVRGSDGTAAGAILAVSPRPDAFTEDDCHFLRTVANVLAAAQTRQLAEDTSLETIARLDTLLEHSPVAFGFFDRDYRFVRLNQRFAALSGLPVEEHLGRPIADVLPDLWAQALDGFGSVLEGAHPEADVEVTAQLAEAPGLERHFLVSCYPVRPTPGADSIAGLGVLVVDITERRRAELAASLMSSASELFARRGVLSEVLDEAARLPIPDFADSCLLYLFAAESVPWHAATAHSDGGVLRLDPEGGVLHPIDPATPGAIGDAVESGRAQLVAAVTEQQRTSFAKDDDHRRQIEDNAPTSAIVAPLVARGETLGLAFLTFTAASSRRYRPDDLPLAEQLAARVAQVVDAHNLETAAQLARRRLDLLARTGSLMSVALDTGERMERFARIPIPDFADLCALHLLNDDGSFRLEQLQSKDDELGELVAHPERWVRVPAGVPTPNADACVSRRAVLVADLPAEVAAALGAEAGSGVRTRGIQSVLCAPLIGLDGDAFGTATFVRGTSHPPYTEDDVPLAEELAHRAAGFFQHALRFEHERATAEVLQRSLLPERLPVISGIATAARYLPGGVSERVGGDWYDVVAFRDGGASIAIGDVVGHGVLAASSTGQLRAGMHLAALEGLRPAIALDRMNRLLLAMPDSAMATVCVLHYDPADGVIGFSSAGHPPPLLLRADGTSELVESTVGFPLRASAAARYEDRRFPFTTGDTLVLYTDGLVERRGESLDVGLARLQVAAAAPDDDLDALADRLLGALLPPGGPTDDVALLVLRAVDETVPLRLELPARAEELATARGALRSWLAVAGADTTAAADIVLATNEALANAVEHGSPTSHGIVRLAIQLDEGAVVVEVVDRGRWIERPPRPDRGRGLKVMRAVMDDVQIDPAARGTTITLRRQIRP